MASFYEAIREFNELSRRRSAAALEPEFEARYLALLSFFESAQPEALPPEPPAVEAAAVEPATFVAADAAPAVPANVEPAVDSPAFGDDAPVAAAAEATSASLLSAPEPADVPDFESEPEAIVAVEDAPEEEAVEVAESAETGLEAVEIAEAVEDVEAESVPAEVAGEAPSESPLDIDVDLDLEAAPAEGEEGGGEGLVASNAPVGPSDGPTAAAAGFAVEEVEKGAVSVAVAATVQPSDFDVVVDESPAPESLEAEGVDEDDIVFEVDSQATVAEAIPPEIESADESEPPAEDAFALTEVEADSGPVEQIDEEDDVEVVDVTADEATSESTSEVAAAGAEEADEDLDATEAADVAEPVEAATEPEPSHVVATDAAEETEPLVAAADAAWSEVDLSLIEATIPPAPPSAEAEAGEDAPNWFEAPEQETGLSGDSTLGVIAAETVPGTPGDEAAVGASNEAGDVGEDVSAAVDSASTTDAEPDSPPVVAGASEESAPAAVTEPPAVVAARPSIDTAETLLVDAGEIAALLRESAPEPVVADVPADPYAVSDEDIIAYASGAVGEPDSDSSALVSEPASEDAGEPESAVALDENEADDWSAHSDDWAQSAEAEGTNGGWGEAPANWTEGTTQDWGEAAPAESWGDTPQVESGWGEAVEPAEGIVASAADFLTEAAEQNGGWGSDASAAWDSDASATAQALAGGSAAHAVAPEAQPERVATPGQVAAPEWAQAAWSPGAIPTPAPMAGSSTPPPVAAPEPVVDEALPVLPLPSFLPGEHRIILHTLEGQVKRGVATDIDLEAEFLSFAGASGEPEPIPFSRTKAVFFLLKPGEVPSAPDAGRRVRVTFIDGRQVEGLLGDEHELGFFLAPLETRSNTANVLVMRHAVRTVA